ncbi:hypothetical protein EG68_03173 [Paragonimus skrjabini miyazakii]|uniref:Uncharacterized protein n=1 Tax=Paragonimus skrjabini miyazakii TaxID=59628 RepID=A0A8S9YYS7_9TREM|nr:hypothetical protein EG68_03173 [Paragonimus skrjabini miyazakii]
MALYCRKKFWQLCDTRNEALHLFLHGQSCSIIVQVWLNFAVALVIVVVAATNCDEHHSYTVHIIFSTPFEGQMFLLVIFLRQACCKKIGNLCFSNHFVN